LDITYGLKKIGMNYDRMRFGLKVSDAQALARYFPQCSILTSLTLQCNIIDDDLLKMLFNGLSQNNSVTCLDLAHNRISNHGVRLLSKLLMDPNCVLARLNLADNQVHVEGGRYLGRGLRENSSLVALDVHMNRLADEGVRMLLEGLQDNVTLHTLNLRANGAGSDTAQAISALLRDSQHHLQCIDLATNNLSANDISLLHMAVLRNRSLWSLDLRGNPGVGGSE
jgi:Ran GTPase-activating protein (RanGAP) involved in mRNA processing and transport